VNATLKTASQTMGYWKHMPVEHLFFHYAPYVTSLKNKALQ